MRAEQFVHESSRGAWAPFVQVDGLGVWCVDRCSTSPRVDQEVDLHLGLASEGSPAASSSARHLQSHRVAGALSLLGRASARLMGGLRLRLPASHFCCQSQSRSCSIRPLLMGRSITACAARAAGRGQTQRSESADASPDPTRCFRRFHGARALTPPSSHP